MQRRPCLLILASTLVSFPAASAPANEPDHFGGKTATQWTAQLRDKDVAARWYAAHALGELGPNAAAAVPVLEKVLDNRGENEYVRGNAAWALGCIGPAAQSAVSLLVETSASQHHLSVRRNAVWALGRIGPGAKSAAETLVKRLEDQDATVRANAAVALWRIAKHPRAIPTLVEMARSGQGDAAYQGVVALGQLGPQAEAAAPVLAQLLRANEDVSRAAGAALARIGPRVALATIKPLLRSSEETTRRRAVEVLERLGPDGLRELTSLLRDSSPLVRKAAARALGRLGSSAQESLPALLDAVSDQSPEVRETAAEAIQRIRAADQTPRSEGARSEGARSGGS